MSELARLQFILEQTFETISNLIGEDEQGICFVLIAIEQETDPLRHKIVTHASPNLDLLMQIRAMVKAQDMLIEIIKERTDANKVAEGDS